MTDLERALAVMPFGDLARLLAEGRREGAAEMRERAARECEALGDKPGHDCVASCAALIRALPLTPEEPAVPDDIVIVRSEGMLSAYRRGEEPAACPCGYTMEDCPRVPRRHCRQRPEEPQP